MTTRAMAVWGLRAVITLVFVVSACLPLDPPSQPTIPQIPEGCRFEGRPGQREAYGQPRAEMTLYCPWDGGRYLGRKVLISGVDDARWQVTDLSGRPIPELWPYPFSGSKLPLLPAGVYHITADFRVPGNGPYKSFTLLKVEVEGISEPDRNLSMVSESTGCGEARKSIEKAKPRVERIRDRKDAGLATRQLDQAQVLEAQGNCGLAMEPANQAFEEATRIIKSVNRQTIAMIVFGIVIILVIAAVVTIFMLRRRPEGGGPVTGRQRRREPW